MCWPDFFPVGCPDSDTPVAQGEVFRLVDNDPPSADEGMGVHPVCLGGNRHRRLLI